jgi:hypothetical protein
MEFPILELIALRWPERRRLLRHVDREQRLDGGTNIPGLEVAW